MNYEMMSSMLKRFTELLHTSPIKYIIIICPSPPIRYKGIINESPKIIFWDNKKIEELIEENADAIESIVNNLFKLDIENEIRKSSDDWKKSRLDILNEIKKAYKKGNISLLLGAGVSCSAGFPNWGTLLNSLYANFVNKVLLFSRKNYANRVPNGKMDEKLKNEILNLYLLKLITAQP